MIGFPDVMRIELDERRQLRHHPCHGDIRELLVRISSSNVGVSARKPNLFEMSAVAIYALPEGRTEAVTWLIEGEGLKSIFDFVGDLGVGEAPREGTMLVPNIYRRQWMNLLFGAAMQAYDWHCGNTKAPDCVPHSECFDCDLCLAILESVSRVSGLLFVSC